MDTPYHVLALKMIKEIKRVTTIKRATKFMKRDDIALDRIYRILAKSREMEKEIESGSESDDDSSNENRGNSPRYTIFRKYIYTFPINFQFFKKCPIFQKQFPIFQKISNFPKTNPGLHIRNFNHQKFSGWNENGLRKSFRRWILQIQIWKVQNLHPTQARAKFDIIFFVAFLMDLLNDLFMNFYDFFAWTFSMNFLQYSAYH